MKRILGGLGVLLLVASLTVVARAAHPTQICLDVRPDREGAISNDGDAEELEAAVGATDSDHAEPHEEGCVIGEGGAQTQIDFEITGVADPDESDTPESPDMSCTTRDGTAFCTVLPPSASGGEQTIAAWIDFDQDDSTVELDMEEEVDDEDADATDVALWTWTHGDYFLYSSIRYEGDRARFTGALYSEPGCESERDVTVKKRIDGRRVSIGSDLSNLSGIWSVPREHPRGRFFAVAKPGTAADGSRCRRLRSTTIRLR